MKNYEIAESYDGVTRVRKKSDALSCSHPAAGSVSKTLQLIEKASNHIDDLCQGKKRWTMSVPVDEKNDSDCILQNALTEAKKLIEKQNRVIDEK